MLIHPGWGTFMFFCQTRQVLFGLALTLSLAVGGCDMSAEDFFPGCGNENVDIGEECDDGNEDNTDGCTNLCLRARCGDGHVQEAFAVMSDLRIFGAAATGRQISQLMTGSDAAWRYQNA